MTDAHYRLRQLKTDLKKLLDRPIEWKDREYDVFFEIEAILHLYEMVFPDQSTHRADDAWMLIAGYGIPGISDTTLRSCLLLREQLRYVKTASAWRSWLKWYKKQPICLYDIKPESDGALYFRQRHYGVELRADRLAAYEALFTAEGRGRDDLDSPEAAPAGRYTFMVDGTLYEIEISEAMAAFAHTTTPSCNLPRHTERSPIWIDLEALLETARELDDLEAQLKIPTRGNWYDRLCSFQWSQFNENHTLEAQRQIKLEGLFHLAGALGVGKSSLIWVLTYHLARWEGRHVTVMVNTVVEALRLAAWLRQLGVAATPALGRQRDKHEIKYGLANARTLNNNLFFQPNATSDPTLAWMPAPCALSGAHGGSIPTGKEPCYRLYNEAQDQRFACPLIPVCPVHQLARDLVDSEVWVVNPMSFLYSLISGFGKRRIPLYEAVYHRSDVLIIDEADRVQVQWDRAFAPTRLLAGSDDALLDGLHRLISNASVGVVGRRRAARAAFNRLTRIDSQAHILSNHLFRLLSTTPRIVKWIKRRQLTNVGLFSQLATAFSKMSPADPAAQKALKKALMEEFRQYWANPLRQQEQGDFHVWVNRLLGTDIREQNLQRELRQWATKRLGWGKTLDSRKRLLLRKLDFCLTLAALLKRTSDIFYQLNWIDDEVNAKESLKSSDFEPADALVNLIPDPPLGVVLGARLIHHVPERSLGMLNAMRYRGIGRWLLLNFVSLYKLQTGWHGPHMLLTSATSWLPGSAQFHLAVSPHALLLPNDEASSPNIDIKFRPVRLENSKWIHVSGAGKRRELRLRQLVRKLATGGKSSDLQEELDYWRDSGKKRSILLVVNSYEQAKWMLEELERLPEWQGRVRRLIPDDAEFEDEFTMHAREVEQFYEHEADILIAPLMAIQRGFNILDEEDAALLGTAYFLVRPFPPPDDISPQVLGMNAWLLDQLQPNTRILREEYSSFGIQAIQKLRLEAYKRWNQRMTAGQRGVAGMDAMVYDEFLRDQFVTIWQTIGRLLRGGRDARVYFADGAFAPKKGKRRMLPDWCVMLDALLHADSDVDQQIAASLYGTAWQAFRRAAERKEIF